MARIQKMTRTTAYVFPSSSATAATFGSSAKGQRQPPRNSNAVSRAMTKVLMYSARKNTAQWAPLYSTKGPPTTSDSAK